MNPRPNNVLDAMIKFAELRSAWQRNLGRALREGLLGAAGQQSPVGRRNTGAPGECVRESCKCDKET